MRRAMVCATFMLAVLQFWPMLFGSKSVIGIAAPVAQAAVVIPVPPPAVPPPTGASSQIVLASVRNESGPSNCFVRYRATFAACAKGDLACGGIASDDWDLCEATGFWPN